MTLAVSLSLFLSIVGQICRLAWTALITPTDGIHWTIPYAGKSLVELDEARGAFDTCWTGPAICSTEYERCKHYDFDDDGDIDQADFGAMQLNRKDAKNAENQ